MSQNVVRIQEGLRSSLIPTLAARFGLEAGAFEATMRSIMPSNCTWEQFTSFLLVAKEYNLNPILKEIYAFPTRGGGIQPIVGVDGWINIINSHPQCDGIEFKDGMGEDNKLASVTCKIYRKDRSHPTEVTEYMSECFVDKSEPWKRWPARMLRHKALIQCGRYAFGFSGIMDEDEYQRMESASVIGTTAPPAPPASATVVEAEPINTAGLIADWEMRLKMAARPLQDEIFEIEIEPRREAGEIGHTEYNSLINLLKEPVVNLDDPSVQP